MKKLKYIFILFASILLFAAAFDSCKKDDQANDDITEPKPDELTKFEDGAPIPGQYIVVYKNEFLQEIKAQYKNALSSVELNAAVKSETVKFLTAKQLSPDALTYSYGASIAGFAGKLNEAEVNKLKADPRVAYIEQDRFISLGKPTNGSPSTGAQVVPWGINRVVTNYTNSYSTTNVAWIIDTGIDFDHPDLNVDVNRSVSFISGSSADDQNGHGTHVSGTIGAKNNTIGVVGVAPGCTVIAVRVLGPSGSGSVSGVIAGVNHVATYGQNGDVANMSLGGSGSSALDNAVIAASNSNGKHIYFAVAAGNDGRNASNYSPARANGTYVYTISAMDNKDMFAYFSNYGNPPVDYCAPGVSVYSTYKGGGYATLSGTSMATPHVAGLLLRTGGQLQTSGTVKNDKDSSPDPIAHE